MALKTVPIPDAYISRGEANLPYAEGWSAFAGSNPFAAQSALPSLPGLPSIPSLPDVFKSIPKMSDISGADVGGVVWWLTGRYVTVFVGLLLLAAGLYLLGTSQVSDALGKAALKAVA